MKKLLAIYLCCLTAQAAVVRTTISSLPQITTPSTNTYFEVADMSATPRSRKLSIGDLRTSINATATNVNGSGTANTLTKWTGTNTLGSVANGEGILVNDGSGAFVWTTDVGAISETITYLTTIISNAFFVTGKGATLVITQYVRFPYTNLVITGTNVATPNLTAATHFKLTLTTNAFVPAPAGLPGTNTAQTIQFVAQQDATGGRTLTWNAAWKFAGGSPPTMTTNANAVDAFTFVSSPFDATVLYGVPAQNF